MIRIVRLASLAAALALVSAALARTDARAAQPGCIQARYDSDAVALTGVLRRKTYPGPPNYEDVRQGDEAETGYYLQLDRGVCAPATEFYSAAKDVRDVQLVLDRSGYDRLRPRLGTRVTVTGRIFGAHTGHHHAPVLVNLVGVHAWQLGIAPQPNVGGRPQAAIVH
jgi:hypothetical protein